MIGCVVYVGIVALGIILLWRGFPDGGIVDQAVKALGKFLAIGFVGSMIITAGIGFLTWLTKDNTTPPPPPQVHYRTFQPVRQEEQVYRYERMPDWRPGMDLEEALWGETGTVRMRPQ